MKLPISIAKQLILLNNGQKIPYSKLKHPAIELMLENGILKKQVYGRSKSSIYLNDITHLSTYLKNHYGIENIEDYVNIYNLPELSRAELIEISSNSKLKAIRTFKGFLVNSYEKIDAILNGRNMVILPDEGSYTFIYDYDNFHIPEDIVVVGIENPESFRFIINQKSMFMNDKVLFVSRYPQNKDLVRWLKQINNKYYHFGDFDFAGLNIYYNEYKFHLKDRAHFFIPPHLENFFKAYGNRTTFDNQTLQREIKELNEIGVQKVIQLINKYKKGLEQEIYIKNSLSY